MTDPIYPPQPQDSLIDIHQASPDRLVLYVPPGKGSRTIGLFALLWNGFMVVFSSVFFTAFAQKDAPEFGVLPLLFVGLFWLIGVGFMLAWVRMRFERSILLVEPGRAVLRRILFGWQRQTELLLDELSRAQLTESYQENDVPVYRITILGAGGDLLHFGTSLSASDKDWCVDAINALLKPLTVPSQNDGAGTVDSCGACGETLPRDAIRNDHGEVICQACGHRQPASMDTAHSPELLAELLSNTPIPDELPGVVHILEESPDRLAYSIPWTEWKGLRRTVLVITAVAALIWTGFSARTLMTLIWFDQPPQGRDPFSPWFELAFTVPVLLSQIASWSLVVLAAFGRLTTSLDADQLRVRFHCGFLGKTWVMPTRDIREVRLTSSADFPGRIKNPRVASENSRVISQGALNCAAAAFSSGPPLILTVFHRPETARFVVHKVQTWLDQWRRSSPSAVR